MLKISTLLLLVLMLFSTSSYSQWIYRSRLGHTNQQSGELSNSASFTFSTPQIGYSYYNISGSPSGGDPNMVRKSIKHGRNWNVVLAINNSEHYSYLHIESLHPDTAYVVNNNGENYTFATYDGGENWTMVCYGGSGYIYDFFQLDNGTFYMATPSYLVRYSNGVRTILLSNYQILDEISFVDTITGFATRMIPNTTDYSLVTTTDGGRNWSTLYTISDTLSELFFTSHSNGYIVQDSTLLYTNDGGITITPLVTPNSEKINYIYCLNDSTIYCAGNDGEIMHSIDYGQTWILEDIGSMDLIKIKMFDIGMGYVSSADQYLYAKGLDLTSRNEKTYQSTLLITPNPATSHITVSTDRTKHILSNVHIINSSGINMATVSLGNNSFDVSRLPKGVYVLNAEIDGSLHTGKFLIQ